MDDAHDRDLIRRCRAGEEAAFGQLVDRYKDLVYGLVSRAITDRARADDLAQEVFLRVHRGLAYFRGDAKLSTWIYRITANVCLQERGRSGSPTFSLDTLPAGADDDLPRPEYGAPDRAFDAIELRDRLEKAVALLPAHYRFLIAAHYLSGVQYEDLAEVAGVPLGTVKTHLFRARRQLRGILERLDAGERLRAR